MKYKRLELEEFLPKQKLRLLQNSVGEVAAYVKQIGDNDVDRGNRPLVYETYMELLLSACATYDKRIALPGKQKRAGYASEFDSDTYIGNYEAYRVDTNVADIRANATDTNRSGNRQDYGNKKTFVPWEQWNKLSQEQKEKLIAERQKERMNNTNSKPRVPYPPRQTNMHEVADVFEVDIIDDAILKHEVTLDGDDNKGTSTNNDSLLAYMAGHRSLAGDIHKVMATKTKVPPKGKSGTSTSRKVNTSKSTPSTIQVDDNTYYLYKGESLEVDGHQYFAHVTNINYWIGQHDVTKMEFALVDCGANGGVCGDDMLVLEGSKCFVDVSGLAGHKVSQLRIATAEAMVTTHKGDAIATFHQMALLGKGKSILSCLQMETYGANINDCPCS